MDFVSVFQAQMPWALSSRTERICPGQAPEAVSPFSLEFTLSLPRVQTACYFQSPWVLQKPEPLLLCLLTFNFFLFSLRQNTRWLSDKEFACNAGTWV